ncbi:MAG: hypothetical protein ACSLFF_00245 [Solirubrobacterales bacterium]
MTAQPRQLDRRQGEPLTADQLLGAAQVDMAGSQTKRGDSESPGLGMML